MEGRGRRLEAAPVSLSKRRAPMEAQAKPDETKIGPRPKSKQADDARTHTGPPDSDATPPPTCSNVAPRT
jgi:hypothetical protein